MSENKNLIFFKKVLNKLKIKKEFMNDIKLLYAFRHNDVFLVTYEDEVYCSGNNSDGVLGFGHQNNLAEFAINEELSHKQIIDFKNSFFHTIARSKDGKLYCWGCNRLGYLGEGRNDEEIYKPQPNSFLISENIDACCGGFHTLVLTSNKEVYAFGGNIYGQIGNRSNKNVFIPFKVDEFDKEKVKAIACGLKHSMALTESGFVYSWGYNSSGQLGLNNGFKDENKPERIQIGVEIIKISCGLEHSILLSCEGDIYVFGCNKYKQLGLQSDGEKQLTPIKLNHSEKFIEIASHPHYNISTALSIKGLYFVWGKCGENLIIVEPEVTKLNSFDEIFFHYFQISIKTFNKLEECLKSLFFIKKQKYEKKFAEIKHISSGCFGTVYKVLDIHSKKEFAVKKIPLKAGFQGNKEKLRREVKILSKMNVNYVVECFDFWIQKNNSKNNSKLNAIDYKTSFLLHIQMELCYKTLKEIIEIVNIELKSKEYEEINTIKYYILSELFKELVECLNYLHKKTLHSHSIIHRDLKPANILISYGRDGRFVKLADFGLAVEHEFDNQSHTGDTGTRTYMAPEVDGRHYDTKADIYSLGVIARKMFIINNNECLKFVPLKNREVMKKLIEKMTLYDAISRPSCYEILNANLCQMSTKRLIVEKKVKLEKETYSIEESFHLFFIQKKLQYYEKTENESNKGYDLRFKDLKTISFGSSGVVCKVLDRTKNKKYAIKKVPINDHFKEEALKEIKILSKLKSETIVRLKSCWIEKNYYYGNEALIEKLGSDHEIFNTNKILLLHIQMELCYKTLKEIVEIVNKELNQKALKLMKPLGYYISSQIFIEILESIDFLHKQDIIHRNLKPSNILITDGTGGRFVKVADFGLATIHEFDEQSHTKMNTTNFKYTAPELFRSGKYDTKADIYSLGMICQDLFNTSINESIEIPISDSCLANKYSNLFKLIVNMLFPQMSERPNCEKILKDETVWALSLLELKESTDLRDIKGTDSNSIEESFHKFFLQVKDKP